MRIKMTLEYDGAAYGGWQKQINAPSVQEELEKAWFAQTGENTRFTASGRTDAGVHAFGQVVHFDTAMEIEGKNVVGIFNGALPPDIIVRAAKEAAPDFHARFDATAKTYIYAIYNSEKPTALWRERTCFIPKPLDLDAMKRAAKHIVGEHDFSCFKAAGGSTLSDVREINRIKIAKHGDFVTIEVNGNGFLYNMVRIIAGTLVYVGLGKIVPDDLADIILSKDRTRAGKTLPPQGLYLKEVFFGKK